MPLACANLIRCAVAYQGYDGPDIYFVQVRCTTPQYNDGQHYVAAEQSARDLRNADGPFVVIDECDPGKWVLTSNDWTTAPIVDISDDA